VTETIRSGVVSGSQTGDCIGCRVELRRLVVMVVVLVLMVVSGRRASKLGYIRRSSIRVRLVQVPRDRRRLVRFCQGR
jgi:hypothetical protein